MVHRHGVNTQGRRRTSGQVPRSTALILLTSCILLCGWGSGASREYRGSAHGLQLRGNKNSMPSPNQDGTQEQNQPEMNPPNIIEDLQLPKPPVVGPSTEWLLSRRDELQRRLKWMREFQTVWCDDELRPDWNQGIECTARLVKDLQKALVKGAQGEELQQLMAQIDEENARRSYKTKPAQKSAYTGKTREVLLQFVKKERSQSVEDLAPDDVGTELVDLNKRPRSLTSEKTEESCFDIKTESTMDWHASDDLGLFDSVDIPEEKVTQLYKEYPALTAVRDLRAFLVEARQLLDVYVSKSRERLQVLSARLRKAEMSENGILLELEVQDPVLQKSAQKRARQATKNVKALRKKIKKIEIDLKSPLATGLLASPKLLRKKIQQKSLDSDFEDDIDGRTESGTTIFQIGMEDAESQLLAEQSRGKKRSEPSQLLNAFLSGSSERGDFLDDDGANHSVWSPPRGNVADELLDLIDSFESEEELEALKKELDAWRVLQINGFGKVKQLTQIEQDEQKRKVRFLRKCLLRRMDELKVDEIIDGGGLCGLGSWFG